MAPIITALFVTNAAIALAHAGQVGENDRTSLLQAQVQEVSAKQQEEGLVDAPNDYALADALKCKSKEVPVAVAMDAEAAPRLSERHGGATEDQDPPGATTLRATLELMIILIICDGVRRWRLQTQDAQKLKDVCGGEKEHAAAAAEAAWIEMVNASASGDAERFEKALSRSPQLKKTDAWGCTPLHFAAAAGAAKIVVDLLRRGAEVDARDASDETPLHFAARAGHSTVCEALLEAGAEIDAVNSQDMTPLVVAGQANQEPACRLLADRGAGVAGLEDEQLPPLVVSQLVRKVFAA